MQREGSFREMKRHVHYEKPSEKRARQKAEADALTAWARIQSGHAVVGALQLEISANETAAEGVQVQERGGERTLLDVLNAQQTTLRSRVDLARAQHDLTIQDYSLALALGLLLPVAGKAEVDKGEGVITDPAIHERVLRELEEFVARETILHWRGVTESPLLGPAGNKEFLVLLEKTR